MADNQQSCRPGFGHKKRVVSSKIEPCTGDKCSPGQGSICSGCQTNIRRATKRRSQR